MSTMKKRLLIVAGVLILIIISTITFGIFMVFRAQEDPDNVIKSSDIIPFLEDGDVLLRLTNSPLSALA